MNILYFLLLIFTNFLLICAAYKLFGKQGLFGYIVLSLIAANMQVNKMVVYDIGFTSLYATLGNVMFGGVFLATDCLNEIYGKKDAKKSVYISIFGYAAFVLVMFISTLFTGDADSADFNNALDLFFKFSFEDGGVMFKLLIIGVGVYAASQTIDVFVFDKLKEKYGSDRELWIRNNLSTATSQLIDTILFVVLGTVFGIFESEFFMDILITTFVIKVVIAAVDTPFIYLIKKIKPLEDNE